MAGERSQVEDGRRLQCVGLSKEFEGTIALDDVSLSFSDSGCVAIAGPNGAGKTTLINSLTGHVHPDKGYWQLGDRRISGMRCHEIAGLGIARTFQEVRLIRESSVIDNVLLARPRQYGESPISAVLGIRKPGEEDAHRSRAADLVRFVGLHDLGAEQAASLSYGQQKLLGIACCLATDASILVLDEPVAGVDPSMNAKILELLQTLGSRDKLIVFIEHDIDAVRRIADRVIVMDSGRVVADGEPHEVFERSDVIEAYLV